MKIANLIADMLTYSKERQPEYKLCCFNKIVEDTLMTAQGKARDKKVELNSNLDPNIPNEVCIDPTGIYRVLLNLVLNGIDAILHDRGKILVDAKYDVDSDRIHISVSDNGCGIPQNIAARIFDPFFSTKGSGGTGLGLAVTQKIVKEHQGAISLKSVVNKGTTFTILLPAKRA